jgi:hypothetical protein
VLSDRRDCCHGLECPVDVRDAKRKYHSASCDCQAYVDEGRVRLRA